MTYSTGSIEKPSRIGFLDSQEITDGRPLSSNILREMSRNANRLITKPQLVFRLMNNTAMISSSLNSDFEEISNTYRNNLMNWGVACNRWEPLIPRVVVRKPPGHRTAKVRMRIRLMPEDRTFYFKVLSSVQGHQPTDQGITINSSGSAGNLIETEIRLNDAEYENIRFVMRVDYDVSKDPLMNVSSFGGFNQGVAIIGRYSQPTSYISPTGTFANYYDKGMAWAGHYAYLQPQSFNQVSSYHLIKETGFQEFSGTSVGRSFRLRELVGSPGMSTYFYIYKTPEYIIDSISVYTKEEE